MDFLGLSKEQSQQQCSIKMPFGDFFLTSVLNCKLPCIEAQFAFFSPSQSLFTSMNVAAIQYKCALHVCLCLEYWSEVKGFI